MTSLIIILVSAAAISALIALNAWIGGWTPSRIETLDAAIDQIRQDSLSFAAGDGQLSRDQRAALVCEAGSDRIGLVLAQGDILLTRIFHPDDIARVVPDGATLAIRFRDFTLPNASIAFDDEAIAAQWQARLTGAE
ncbi:MAG: hypothetical protein DHS20C06_08330 [Hyphobacterium sp.]|nr:MAG: hypothetical protein DHS20C06_08330 [Hyphobacterium sp.]